MTDKVTQWLARQTPATREQFEERAAILEFEAGMEREDAERKAMELIIERRTK